MCGIVGIASIAPLADHAWLSIARDALTHRGPDDAGEWWSEDSRVGMAHRRLSILDLSPLGHQPMHLPGRRVSVVFNGEIYNFAELRGVLERRGHRFRSQSDTEVLLAAYAEWGTDCLARLNGMFAFALYDAPNQRLFLARDRAGEKPLFHRLEGGSLYFASELKALLTYPMMPRCIDCNALDCYLAMGFVPGDRCILQGYHKLPPGHAMTFHLEQGAVKIWRYWELPELDHEASTADEIALLDELEVLLEDAVGRQLAADVPVGVLLSGGVDSSLVTAMAVRRSSRVRTFSVGFPGHGRLDETPHARLIARYFGTEHTELVAEPTTAELMPTLARQFDEPMADSSMFPTWLVSHLVRQHCTVALGGDGGDELFGGYHMHQRLLWLQKFMMLIPHILRRGVSSVANALMPLGIWGRNYLTSLGYDLNHEVPHFQQIFGPTHRLRLIPQLSRELGTAERIREQRYTSASDLLYRATRFDFENFLAEDILVKVDRTSMINSLEVRAPFLDYRVIEFAFGRVRSNLKATASNKKILLKRLAARVLPPGFDMQRKQGFSIPLDEWLKAGPFRELFWNTLLTADCLFDAQTVLSLLNGQDRGYNNGERLFALMQFELWRKIYRVSF